jgi:hypothetical protein
MPTGLPTNGLRRNDVAKATPGGTKKLEKLEWQSSKVFAFDYLRYTPAT